MCKRQLQKDTKGIVSICIFHFYFHSCIVHPQDSMYMLKCQTQLAFEMFTVNHFLHEFHHDDFYPSQCEVHGRTQTCSSILFVFTVLKDIFVLTLKVKVNLSLINILLYVFVATFFFKVIARSRIC